MARGMPTRASVDRIYQHLPDQWNKPPKLRAQTGAHRELFPGDFSISGKPADGAQS